MIEDPFGWVGHTLGEKLKVEAVVAEGGFGVVYRALHLGFSERVALKCFKLPAKLEDAARDAFLAAFTAEGKLLHRLSRSNTGIVQALDVGAAVSPNGTWTPYLALEWLEGESLEDDIERRLREGAPRRGLLEIIALLDTAAHAIAAAHEQGIAHRDIKPSNLFLTEIGGRRITKVVDFGIAKVMSDVATTTRALAETGPGLSAFTPQYGAPEQFDRHFGATGPWTDVFALALVLVELLAGRSALDGGDTMQLYIAASKTTRRPTPQALGVDVSEAVEAVFARALSVEARLRQPTVGAFWSDLVAAASGKAVVTGGVLAHAEIELAPTALAPPLAPSPPAQPSSPAPGPTTTMPIVTRVRAPGASPAAANAPSYAPARQEGPRAALAAAPALPEPPRRPALAPWLGLLTLLVIGVGYAVWRGSTERGTAGPVAVTAAPPSASPLSPTPAPGPERAAPVASASSPDPLAIDPLAPDPPVTEPLAAEPLSELAPADVGLVDRRGGWEWGDRCYLHIKAGRLAWAKAACDRGLALPPRSPDPRASILYNLGLIEKRRGNVPGARAYFKESADLRPNATVEAALRSLDAR